MKWMIVLSAVWLGAMAFGQGEQISGIVRSGHDGHPVSRPTCAAGS